MKQIKELAEYMQEEIHDACKYIKIALRYKGIDAALADMYYTLSRQELDHAEMQHKQAVRLIDAANRTADEATQSMQMLWDWTHDKLIEDQTNVRVLLEKYSRS